MLIHAEADALIAMPKTFVSSAPVSMPAGTDDTHELVGSDPKERFLLDTWRGAIKLSRLRYQTRGRNVVVLARLDIDGPPHTNPDGARLRGAHMHLYREGYDDKWAMPIDPSRFRDTSDVEQTFADFCVYCHVLNPPAFQTDLI